MTFQHPDIVLDTMWRDLEEADEEHSVFAILDGAREPGIHDDVLRSGLNHRCLYSGEIPEALAQVAPYLVQLDRGDPATRLLIHNGWGHSWGIFFTSNAYLEGLHRHFRRFLKVRDEQGKSLYFRYYDPRVLRAYLPTCDRSELLFVFGPVRSFFVEDDTPDNLLEFVIRDEKFFTYRRPVVPSPRTEPEPEENPEHERQRALMDTPLGGGEDTLVQIEPPGDIARRAAQLADVPIGGGEETLVSPLEEILAEVAPAAAETAPAASGPPQGRQALMEMPLGDPLDEGTLLMPEDELFVESGDGEPEDPESR